MKSNEGDKLTIHNKWLYFSLAIFCLAQALKPLIIIPIYKYLNNFNTHLYSDFEVYKMLLTHAAQGSMQLKVLVPFIFVELCFLISPWYPYTQTFIKNRIFAKRSAYINSIDIFTRKATRGKFRVLGYDQYDYNDYYIDEFDHLKHAVKLLKKRASKANGEPTSFSDVYFIYNEIEEALYKGTFDKGIEKLI